MRLIDADALKELICEHVYQVQDAWNSRDYGMFWTGGIEKAIDDAPTIDAVPVEFIRNAGNLAHNIEYYEYEEWVNALIDDWKEEAKEWN